MCGIVGTEVRRRLRTGTGSVVLQAGVMCVIRIKEVEFAG